MCASELPKVNPTQIQKMIEEFCDWLANTSGTKEVRDSKPVPVRYAGLPDMNIPEWWIETKGHVLETLLKQHLNPFCKQQQRGALIRNERDEIITFQTRTFPEAISRDLVEIFSRLQSAS